MSYEFITSETGLRQYCQSIAESPYIAFDTEFVSEDTYRPELCLVQVATPDTFAILDPLAIGEMQPFWELLASSDHETIVHAGREELRFCLNAIGRRPHRLFDVQLAAGMAGCDFPMSYGNLISRLLDRTLAKGETRTDWRRRPLTQQQLDYALTDVEYLKPLRDQLAAKLDSLGRRAWFDEEMDVWQSGIEASEQTEQWRRVSGGSGLNARSLAVVRELWRWRDSEAKRRNLPPRRVLRDDLIVELARRQSADPRRIRAIRGLEHRGLQNHLKAIGVAIQTALDLPDEELPRRTVHRQLPQFNVLTQFLAAAMANVCREAEIAPTIVGTVDDIRQFVAYRLKVPGADLRSEPVLLGGWRGEMVGRVLEELIGGRLSVKVEEADRDNPLRFEPIN